MSMTGKNRMVDGSMTVRVVIRSLLDELGLRSKISLNFHSIKWFFDSTQAKNIRIGSKPIFFFFFYKLALLLSSDFYFTNASSDSLFLFLLFFI